jgi:hypothetical protein
MEDKNIKEDKVVDVTVFCSYCHKEMECPENMLNADKHVCFGCLMNEKLGLKGKDIHNAHLDIPKDKLEEVMPKLMVEHLVEEVFPQLWSESKEELKELSKKDLAKEMFAAGCMAAIDMMNQDIGEDFEDEKNPNIN